MKIQLTNSRRYPKQMAASSCIGISRFDVMIHRIAFFNSHCMYTEIK